MASRGDGAEEIITGRRAGDGRVRLSLFAGDLLALTVEDYGERAPTLMLTRAQAEELQSALARLIPLLAEHGAEQAGGVGDWSGLERRTTGDLRDKKSA